MNEDELLQALSSISITLCRIYDVLLAGTEPELRRNIEQYHLNGDLLGPPPRINDNPFGIED